MWCADIEKWVADLAVEDLLFVKVSTKLDIHSLLMITGSAAGPLAWSEIDPGHRAFDARGPTKPNFQRPDRGGQRCKCRLVCEWVCTVTSVSVRIKKRANCAKNNKPKSGGLFLVNARPFPEHSSSIATFSAGRAWLEARGRSPFFSRGSGGMLPGKFWKSRCSDMRFQPFCEHFWTRIKAASCCLELWQN